LQKILAIPELPSSFREAARRTLEEKCRIYAQGCAKRGKLTEAQRYYDMLADPAKIGPIGQNRLITAPNISAVGEESHG